MRDKLFIGIDPGVKTGLATWEPKDRVLTCHTLTIWEAYEELKRIKNHAFNWSEIVVVIEDARKRGGSRKAAQGAGWVKTLSGQYEELCKGLGFQVRMVRPGKGKTKVDPLIFQKITGVKTISPGGKILVSNHARDAGLMVFGLT